MTYGGHVMLAIGHLLDEGRELILAEGDEGLRPSHHRVIAHVPPEGITVTELAARVGMTKQGAGQFVTQLSRSGHLRTDALPEDARVRTVRRTPLGDAAAARLDTLLRTLEQTWSARVGAERYEAFRAVLDELAEGVQTGA